MKHVIYISNRLSIIILIMVSTLSCVHHSAWAQSVNTDAAFRILSDVESSIKFLEPVIAPTSNAAALISARTELQDLKTLVDDQLKSVSERLTILSSRLVELGVAQNGEQTEPQDVTDERVSAGEERKLLVLLITRRDEILSRIKKDQARITELRRNAFLDDLTKRTPIGPGMFADLAKDSSTTFLDIWQILRTWIGTVFSGNWAYAGFALLLGGVTTFKFAQIASRALREKSLSDISQLENLIFAFTATAVPTLLMCILVGLSVGLLYVFNLYTKSVQGILNPVFLSGLGVYFVHLLTHNVLRPDEDERRIVPLSTHAAKRVKWLVVAMAVIQACDYVVGATSQAVNAPLSFMIANSFIAAVLISAVLLAIWLIEKDVETKERAFPAWIRIPILFTAIGVVCIALAGYIGLSRFVAQQIVVTGAILATMYLGILAGGALSKPGTFCKTRMGLRLQSKQQFSDHAMDQFGLLASFLVGILTLFIGIPAILLQWGIRFADLTVWGKQIFFGLEIGNFNFSLAKLLFGIVVFLIIVFGTRMVQNWLTNTVLSRTRADVGVTNSIRTGVGYTGIAFAVLLGLTTAGFDLGNLAIIAGALSIGIGFGLQNVVSNFVSGLILLVERPIKVGDFVQAGPSTGTIKKISVRATEIETVNNLSIIVPNSELINAPVTNWTHESKVGRLDLNVGVSYGSDLKLVRSILLDLASKHPQVMKTPEAWVHFVGMGDSSVNFQLRATLKDYTLFPRVQTDLYFDIFELFAKNGIEIPFPQRDLHIRSVDPVVTTALSQK